MKSLLLALLLCALPAVAPAQMTLGNPAFVALFYAAGSNAPVVTTNWITAINTGTPRNDFSGYVGIRFLTGTTNLTVTQLGRVMTSGNSGTHNVSIFTASGGILGTVSVTMSGTANTFVYGTLGSSITLTNATTYYIGSEESSGGDTWYDLDTFALTKTIVATNNTGFYRTGSINDIGSMGYVGLDFKHTIP